MRLIDAHALERAIMDTGTYPENVRRTIRKAPEAVVRCKDCVKWMTALCFMCSFDENGSCTGGPGGAFFCADGKRKEGNK